MKEKNPSQMFLCNLYLCQVKLEPHIYLKQSELLKRVKRITSENRSGSFVGSEFAYEDLGSQELEKI